MTKGIRQLNNFFPACLAIAGMLLLLSAGLSGQAAASVGVSALMNRPANVPEDYVITPFGYFHPSCVLLLAEGNILLADGRVQHADGTVEAAQVCNYPHYTPSGAIVPADAKASQANPLDVNGWLESVSATTSSSYYKITATWVVPPTPKSNDGQCDYSFPGFEDSNDVISIVQPVLQWGEGCYISGAYWLIASWNCCMSGTAWYSTPVDVNVGDTIKGTISPTCKPGNNYCATWNVVSTDVTTGKKTTLAKTPAAGQVWNWAFGAVSEDYGVVQCSDFPDNSGLTFTVHLYDQDGKVISSPNWQGTQWQDGPPDCNYGWKITKTKETVKY
jgi:hypothetical protein